MALQKQPIAINFSRGLDTKTDPFQVKAGNFLELKNSVFTAAGRLSKRNGFQDLTKLPNDEQTTLTTLNDNLIATGSNLYAYSAMSNEWLNKGTVQPIRLSTQPMVRVSTSQTAPDMAVSSNGIVCLAYVDSGTTAYYQLSDSVTGEQIVARTALPATATNPRVFKLGIYFIITFTATVSAASHLQYIAVPMYDITHPGPATDISTVVNTLFAGYDAYSVNDTLYIAWESTSTTVRISSMSNSLTQATAVVLSASAAQGLMSVTADLAAQRVWIAFGAIDSYVAAFDFSLTQVVANTHIIVSTIITEITTVARNGILTVFFETYNFPDGVPADFVSSLTVTPPGSGTGPGTVSATTVILRSVGLVSKPFISPSGTIYLMVSYGGLDVNQSNEFTYFLIDSSGHIFMRLAPTNGRGYAQSQVLATVTYLDGDYYFPYLVADFLASVNKGTDLPSGTPTNAIYTQFGINLAKFTVGTSNQYSSEIAGALHLTGGQLWEYDGVRPVEHGFHVYPEHVAVTTAGTGGFLTAQTYNYVFTYEWTDNQGNLHRSAPSIPVSKVTTGATSKNTLVVPTLRLTYKIAPNPVRIVGYRWSEAQQVYYQFTSLTSPTLNSTTVDSVTIFDTLADSSILGNTLLYTTGGVVENIAAPASTASCMFKNRLFLIDAEDQNLLWYSKQVIENTPVEMSDLFTLFVAPTTGTQAGTGPMLSLSAMDDKLIIFKKNAIYYITGTGPDNTGAQNDFSDPVYITSTIGCDNPNSIVLTPEGIMFQSDGEIWILGRDLSTNYIGAPVEGFTESRILSARTIHATNQVRFILDNNITLMYDYFFSQWSSHTNIAAISSVMYQNLHTYLNSYGHIFQETPGAYLDGSRPVLMSLTTSWINIAGLQGYERFYFGNLLGTYITPFKLNVSLSYDYNSSARQNIIVTPTNFASNYGEEAVWGSGGPWGGPGNVFSARFFPEKQKCQSFQVVIQEVFDASQGQPAGEGLTLSGIALITGMKRGYRTQSARKSFG